MSKSNYRKNHTVGFDSLTPLMLLVYIGLNIAGGVMMQRRFASNPDMATAGWTPTVVWSGVGVGMVLFFVMIVPLVFLGIFITSKIMRFELPGGSILRAGTVAAAPGVIISLIQIVPRNPIIIGLIVVLILPITFYIAHYLFEMTWVETLVSAAFCIPLFVAGQLISILIIGATVTVGVATSRAEAAASPSPFSSTPRQTIIPSPSTPSPPADLAQQNLDSVQRSVERLANGSTDRMTREEMLARIGTLQDSTDKLKAAKGSTDQWKNVSQQLADLTSKAKTLPSEKPDESIDQPLVAEENWSATSNDEEISFGSMNLRPTPDLKLDLQSSASSPEGLTWTWKNSGKLNLKSVPATDTRQRQPWIVPSWLAARVASQKVFMLSTDSDKSHIVRIGEETYLRIENGAGFSHKVIYTTLVDGDWIVATALANGDAQLEQSLETIVRTMRKRSPGQAASDPFAPSRIIPRLTDDPDHAAMILQRSGPALEPALLDIIGGNSDAKLKLGAMKVLAGVATDRSLPIIKPLAASPDAPTADAARAILKRIDPQEFDDIAVAVLDLKNGDHAHQVAALKTLAAAKFDAKRTDVTHAIELIVLQHDLGLRDPAADAMIVWANSDTVTKMLPMLDENADMFQRETAMKVLSTAKDKRAVYPIIRWIIRDGENVVKYLSAMGPVAEDQAITTLRDPNSIARKNAARILQTIGTAKSLPGLQRESTDPRDPAAAQAAQIALEQVRDRVKQAPPATLP